MVKGCGLRGNLGGFPLYYCSSRFALRDIAIYCFGDFFFLLLFLGLFSQKCKAKCGVGGKLAPPGSESV